MRTTSLNGENSVCFIRRFCYSPTYTYKRTAVMSTCDCSKGRHYISDHIWPSCYMYICILFLILCVIDIEEGWTVAKLRKKRRQLKINWALALLITMLEGASYTSITTSFHQFVTNPRSESLGNHSKVS